MPNTHIEHPEDLILTGELSIVDVLYEKGGHVSMKIDGSPSVVWGKHPENGKFFVCTKSAFNKQKIKICYTAEDVDCYFGSQKKVADILHSMLKYIPRNKFTSVYQGDWIGYGGTNIFKPNTLTYVFKDVIKKKLVIAPHTIYDVKGKLCDASPKPLMEIFEDTENIKWVQPTVDRVHQQDIEPFSINKDKVAFLSHKKAKIAKQMINSLIKEGRNISDGYLTDILECPRLANLYQLIIEIKEDLMGTFIVNDSPYCYLPTDEQIIGEGFVFYSDSGSIIKLVNRHQFSYANFNSGRFQ